MDGGCSQLGEVCLFTGHKFQFVFVVYSTMVVVPKGGVIIRLEGLIAGSVYNVRVKVKYKAWFLERVDCLQMQVSTTQGESEFSSSLLFMTAFDEDALNGARKDIMGNSMSSHKSLHIPFSRDKHCHC